MKTQSTLASTLFLICTAASAFAGEQGIINQANALDVTMRFYMHPAHLYLSSEAPHSYGEHPAILVKRQEAEANAGELPIIRPHPALLRRAAKPAKVARSQATEDNTAEETGQP